MNFLYLAPYHGEMSEWLKEHAWKACMCESASGVRIPLSPPFSCLLTFANVLFQHKILVNTRFYRPYLFSDVCLCLLASVIFRSLHLGTVFYSDLKLDFLFKIRGLKQMSRIVKPLTVTTIKNLKPKLKEYSEPDGRGLFLHIYPNGSKIWYFHYKLGGLKRHSIGAFPDFSLEALLPAIVHL